jgi:SLT domain-containing protein
MTASEAMDSANEHAALAAEARRLGHIRLAWRCICASRARRQLAYMLGWRLP